MPLIHRKPAKDKRLKLHDDSTSTPRIHKKDPFKKMQDAFLRMSADFILWQKGWKKYDDEKLDNFLPATQWKETKPYLEVLRDFDCTYKDFLEFYEIQMWPSNEKTNGKG